MPTTAQALQWLRMVHQLGPDPVVSHARSAAADAERQAAERAAAVPGKAVDW